MNVCQLPRIVGVAPPRRGAPPAERAFLTLSDFFFFCFRDGSIFSTFLTFRASDGWLLPALPGQTMLFTLRPLVNFTDSVPEKSSIGLQ